MSQKNKNSVSILISKCFSFAFPLFAGAYLGVYLCNTLSAKSSSLDLAQQLRIKVVDMRSQPLSGTQLNCPGLNLKGTTDTFGEITVQAQQKSFSICRLKTATTAAQGLSNTHFRLVSVEKDQPMLIALRRK